MIYNFTAHQTPFRVQEHKQSFILLGIYNFEKPLTWWCDKKVCCCCIRWCNCAGLKPGTPVPGPVAPVAAAAAALPLFATCCKNCCICCNPGGEKRACNGLNFPSNAFPISSGINAVCCWFLA